MFPQINTNTCNKEIFPSREVQSHIKREERDPIISGCLLIFFIHMQLTKTSTQPQQLMEFVGAFRMAVKSYSV